MKRMLVRALVAGFLGFGLLYYVAPLFVPLPGELEEGPPQGRLYVDRSGEEVRRLLEDELRAEYRAIAERRVRLGLLLAKVGEDNSITVTQEDLNQALIEQVRSYPGHEQAVMNYYRQNPQAMEELRPPIFENKVVDYILELAQVTERTVTPEELKTPDPDAKNE